jgi:hypothetical protein
MLKEPTCNGALSIASPVGSTSFDDFSPFPGARAELLPDTLITFHVA